MPKTCGKCHEEKNEAEFSRLGGNRVGYQSYCRSCMSQYRKDNRERVRLVRAEYKANNAETLWDKRLQSQYGITLQYYKNLLEQQSYRCAICKTETPDSRDNWKNFYIDHDHDCCSGKKSCGSCVRGLLCGSCNFGIGHLNNEAKLDAAKTYLRKKTCEKN